MRYRLKKWLLCVLTMTLVGGASSWAAIQDPQGVQTESREEDNDNLEEENEGQEAGGQRSGDEGQEVGGQRSGDEGQESAGQPTGDDGQSEDSQATEDNRRSGAGQPLGDDGQKEDDKPAESGREGKNMSSGLPDWLSEDSILMLAAGFGAGLAAALAVFGIRFMIRKKERDKKNASGDRKGGQKMEGDSCITERVSGKTGTAAETRAVRLPAPASMPDAAKGTVGTVHHIGRRKSQQDTFGVNLTNAGLLAIVSDGMGGLADSDKVSQRAVMGMFQAGNRVSGDSGENPLFEMLSMANEQVLDMLGEDQLYKSGATLLAALVGRGQFHWVAVGDSRIYLYCRGHLFQINREHIYKQELVQEAVNRNISFSRVSTDPQRDRLVSFLGMGELKYIDGSLRPVDVKQGDKLLLMSDGIFNTISEQEIIWILENTDNAAGAAALMEQKVMQADNPKQDNFTCVILDF